MMQRMLIHPFARLFSLAKFHSKHCNDNAHAVDGHTNLRVQQVQSNCNLGWQAPQLMQTRTQVDHAVSIY